MIFQGLWKLKISFWLYSHHRRELLHCRWYTNMLRLNVWKSESLLLLSTRFTQLRGQWQTGHVASTMWMTTTSCGNVGGDKYFLTAFSISTNHSCSLFNCQVAGQQSHGQTFLRHFLGKPKCCAFCLQKVFKYITKIFITASQQQFAVRVNINRFLSRKSCFTLGMEFSAFSQTFKGLQ